MAHPPLRASFKRALVIEGRAFRLLGGSLDDLGEEGVHNFAIDHSGHVRLARTWTSNVRDDQQAAGMGSRRNVVRSMLVR